MMLSVVDFESGCVPIVPTQLDLLFKAELKASQMSFELIGARYKFIIFKKCSKDCYKWNLWRVLKVASL